MENEQLKLENEKLNARLNKAIDVFKEQKATIKRLNEENNELKSNIESKDKAYGALQNTYNEVWSENKQLKEQVDSCEFNAESDANNLADLQKQLNEYELKLQNSEAAYEELRKKYTEAKSLNDDSINAGAELGKENAELRAKISKLEHDSESFNALSKDYVQQISELNAQYEMLKKKYQARKEKEAELLGQVESLTKENVKVKFDIDNITKEYEAQLKKCEETVEMLKKNLKSVENTTNEEVKKVTVARDEWIAKYRDLEKVVKEQDNQIKDYKITLEESRSAYVELQQVNDNNLEVIESKDKEYKKLEKLYNDIENEKYGWEADFISLEERYKNALLQLEENDKYRAFVEGLHTLAESVNITWKKPDAPIVKDKTEVVKKKKTQEQKIGEAMVNPTNEMMRML